MDGRLRVLLRAGLVVAGVVIVVVVMALGNGSIQRRGYANRVADIRADGKPVTFAELEAWHPPAIDGENAAPTYLKAFALLRDDQADFDDAELPLIRGDLPKSGPLNPSVQTEIELFVVEHRDALKLLHDAASVGGCRHYFDLSDTLNSYLDLAQPAHDGVRLLCLEAVGLMEAGDRDGAVGSLRSAFKLAESMDVMPFYMSRLVHLACYGSIVETVGRFLNVSTEQTSGLTDILSSLRKANDDEALYRTYVGERCFIISTIAETRESSQKTDEFEYVWLEDPPNPYLFRMYDRVGLQAMDNSEQIEALSQKVIASQLPLPDRLDKIQEIEDNLKRPPTYRYYGRLDFDQDMGISRRFHLADAVNLARIRLTIRAIQLRRYEKLNGAFPDSLSELGSTDASLLDPLDGQPLRYTREAGGCMLYSVGHNRRDDRGSEEVDAETYQFDDVVLRLVRGGA